MKVNTSVFGKPCALADIPPGATFEYFSEAYIKVVAANRHGVSRYFAVRLRDGVAVYDWDDKSISPVELQATLVHYIGDAE